MSALQRANSLRQPLPFFILASRPARFCSFPRSRFGLRGRGSGGAPNLSAVGPARPLLLPCLESNRQPGRCGVGRSAASEHEIGMPTPPHRSPGQSQARHVNQHENAEVLLGQMRHGTVTTERGGLDPSNSCCLRLHRCSRPRNCGSKRISLGLLDSTVPRLDESCHHTPVTLCYQVCRCGASELATGRLLLL